MWSKEELYDKLLWAYINLVLDSLTYTPFIRYSFYSLYCPSLILQKALRGTIQAYTDGKTMTDKVICRDSVAPKNLLETPQHNTYTHELLHELYYVIDIEANFWNSSRHLTLPLYKVRCMGRDNIDFLTGKRLILQIAASKIIMCIGHIVFENILSHVLF